MLLSLFIYLFYRTGKTVVNDLILNVISCDQFLILQKEVSSAIPVPEHIIYSLPGGLWVFCVTLASKRFFIAFGETRVNLLFLPLIFAIGLELFQLLHFTNGRFDIWDIGFSVLGWCFGWLVFRKELPTENFAYTPTISRAVCIATFLVVFLAHVWKD